MGILSMLGGPLSGGLGGAITPFSGLGMAGGGMSGLGLLGQLFGGGGGGGGSPANQPQQPAGEPQDIAFEQMLAQLFPGAIGGQQGNFANYLTRFGG